VATESAGGVATESAGRKVSAIPRQSVAWDERRNSSRVFEVPPDALPNAMAALAAFKRSQPALYEWVAEGAPNMTEAQHFERFGEPYNANRSRKVAGVSLGESGAPQGGAI